MQPTSIVSTYEKNLGFTGKETFNTMYALLRKQKEFSDICQITFDADKRHFTLFRSAHIDPKRLQAIFDAGTYRGWKPYVLPEFDTTKNRVIKLICIEWPHRPLFL